MNSIWPFIKPPHWTKDKNAHLKLKIGNTLFYEIKKSIKGFTVLFLLILPALSIIAGLILFNQVKEGDKFKYKAAQDIKYHHYFINPEDEEVNALDLNGLGEAAGLRQLTFDKFPKSNLEVFEKNNMFGYFQNVRRRNDLSKVSNEEYYNDYIRLMIKKEDNSEPFEVYRGDVHTSNWEWQDNNHVTVYRSCGTECMYYYLINIVTKKTENEGLAYGD